jgi:hypothetical protein
VQFRPKSPHSRGSRSKTVQNWIKTEQNWSLLGHFRAFLGKKRSILTRNSLHYPAIPKNQVSFSAQTRKPFLPIWKRNLNNLKL